jgi:glycosyltransferase involved in cell wall biosynthesis
VISQRCGQSPSSSLTGRLVDKAVFISVVIPLFNKKQYVTRAVHSVLNQAHTDFELIVVDDGSTDGGAEIVRSISDPRIRLFSQKNGGVSRARNAGVEMARAEWIAFLDADDEYELDFLQQVVAFLRERQHCDISMLGTNHYRGTRAHPALSATMETGVCDYFDLIRNQRSPSNSSSTVVNKLRFLESKGFPEGVRQFEDWILWCKLAFLGEYGYIKTPLAFIDRVPDSASRRRRPSRDFYNDARLLPLTIREYMEKHSPGQDMRTHALEFASEFSVNVAGVLAHDGAKLLGIRMLRFVNSRAIMGNRKGNLAFLLLHLLVPQFAKQIVWRLRRCS